MRMHDGLRTSLLPPVRMFLSLFLATSVRSMGTSFGRRRRQQPPQPQQRQLGQQAPRRGSRSMNGTTAIALDVNRRFLSELNAATRRSKEVDELKFQVDRLTTENSRLRSELKMQKSTCAKLIQERNGFGERAALVEKDKDKMQNMFKMYRESKEKEVQDLLRAKRELEERLAKLGGVVGEEMAPATSPQRESTSDLFSNPGQLPGEWWLGHFDGFEMMGGSGATGGGGGIQSAFSTGRGPELARAFTDVDGPFTNVSKSELVSEWGVLCCYVFFFKLIGVWLLCLLRDCS